MNLIQLLTVRPAISIAGRRAFYILGSLAFFMGVLITNEDENAEISQKVIQLWLDNYWPKSGKNRTTKMSEIIAKCGYAKSETIDWFFE